MIDSRVLHWASVAMLLGPGAGTAMALSIEGAATYRERVALRAAVLEDVSRADAPADVIARTRQMAATQMACLNPPGTEAHFRAALNAAARYTIAGDRLALFDAAGKQLAAFTAGTQVPGSPASPLEGTSWQLVKFQGSDGTTLTPDDRAKYTIDFAPAGRLTARVDCNRGRGTWKSVGANQLELGALALTRALCPPGSLHDHIVKQWGNIRSYVIRDGHLFLALMADGGIYEFKPIQKPAP